ncbi:GlsB/YeaQ/YmgE family stress response membrane protein, partial [Staphylococcus aureus]|uniref:GlsB/YeaQ/YmgE family stress response membrane protein n=1 Tax=Staphylococcus aureus TaxID=1280 RepID=UPI00210959F1
FVGHALLGCWGLSLAGMALIPSFVGAVIVVAVVSLITFCNLCIALFNSVAFAVS